jgi:shikimate dehydrogenase
VTHYGLLGKKLSHSFSKNYFTNKFSVEKIHAIYENFEFENEDALKLFLQTTSIHFFNITIPYKESIFPIIDEVDTIANNISAINCIKKVDNKWYGTNTDAIGFEKSFISKLKSNHNKALILGNGGASKAVQFILKKLNIPFVIVSRTFVLGGLNYHDINEEIITNYPIVINTTPLGMYPNITDAPPLPYHLMNENNYLFDLIYNPTESLFLQKGKLQNAIISNGLEMLETQALASWEFWNS